MSTNVTQGDTGSRHFHYLTAYGATLIDAGRTRFDLWAPSLTAVELELETPGSEPQRLPMSDEGEGHFSIEADCGRDTAYRFRIREDLAVPDPAARAQHGDVQGASRVVDPQAFRWRHGDWPGRPWHEAVILEVHVGLLGGFAAVSRQLAQWAGQGITAIELMPINEFPGARNWGYDGVLPYAVEASYGTPEELKALIDTAHGLGLMVLLDVVYNHFGPDGNYLPEYAAAFFREDVATPWGAAIDFRHPGVQRFFIDNALMWLMEYRFDGLRLDAVHAIDDDDFLRRLSDEIDSTVELGRHVHLVLEDERNSAGLLESAFTAQWNDDFHNVMHVLLTDEQHGYYADYSEQPTAGLARVLGEGFLYQGQPNGRGEPRGAPSVYLPPTRFVHFLQNHDQIGNRAFGERLIELVDSTRLEAATVLLLLAPPIPMLFMGEQWGETRPFLFFTDHRPELAEAVREGRRGEFAAFPAFADPEVRATIPDPNAEASFTTSQPRWQDDDPRQQHWLDLHQRLLALRHAEIVPRLEGVETLDAEVLGDRAVHARWKLGDGSLLSLAVNLGDTSVMQPVIRGHQLFEWGTGEQVTELPGGAIRVWRLEAGV
ncbi:maltooligosyl trehalose hydrolase [Kushneria sinocarnis]|uniref:Malto-oligosyltrehalose trehalohydrolase n=1 Tax=Kushneria sinocarnis TaxID=595502 RepID=A0A420WX35_9GAMM|nr:malto-oligosyltrehalose trehalohydrolase [Kushneria sinocarnis]RKR04311.1 maltooligosyl trehalose hydrolase [Kushneria sinocarnis]